jgi:hypothetical protein
MATQPIERTFHTLYGTFLQPASLSKNTVPLEGALSCPKSAGKIQGLRAGLSMIWICTH